MENPDNEYFKESNKTVDHFIRNKIEEPIKNFFMKDIDNLLKKYKLGEAFMKPDVLKQMKTLDENYKKMGGVMINENGKEPRSLLPNEIIQIMNNQMEQLQLLTQKNEALEKMVANLQKKKSDDIKKCDDTKKSDDSKFTDILLKRINELERENTILKNENNKSENNKNDVSYSHQPSQIISSLQIKSKTTPEIVVDIHN